MDAGEERPNDHAPKPMSAKDRLNARLREEFLRNKEKERERETAQQPCKKEGAP